jgi:hypothetical protein
MRAVCEREKVSREPISTKSAPIRAAVRSVRLWSIMHSFVVLCVLRVRLREANTDESPSPAHGKRGLHSGARPRPHDCFRMGVLKKDGAYEHRMLRREPGYTVPMLMEESRILRGVIFKIRNNNLPFSRCHVRKLPLDVIPIADELGWQLKQATFA